MISGFEPLDLLQSVQMVLRQLDEGRCEVENQYRRVVPYEGNPRALETMAEVFELRPHFEWRGLGFISHSGLRLSDAYRAFDAEAMLLQNSLLEKQGIAPPYVLLWTIFRGCFPFLTMVFVTMLLVYLFPQIHTYLPNLFYGN